jgi:hypothetical protein
MTTIITEIKIPCRWAKPHPTGTSVSDRDAVAVFSLGVGPCGKEVNKLDMVYDNPAYFAVVQYCDGEAKTFVYPYHTITGRIKITEK